VPSFRQKSLHISADFADYPIATGDVMPLSLQPESWTAGNKALWPRLAKVLQSGQLAMFGNDEIVNFVT
jgi:hypothetical protein